MINVTGLRNASIQTPKYDESVEYYSDVWGLTQVPGDNDDETFFRGTGPESYIFSVRRSDHIGFANISLALGDRASVDEAANELKAGGYVLQSEPHELLTPGGGYGFTFSGPDGREIELSSDVQQSEPITDQPYAPIRLGHFVFNTPDVESLIEFFTSKLGFEVTDYYEKNLLVFLSCNEAHHCIALAKSETVSIHHISYDLESIDALMRNIGRTTKLEQGPVWGPGRHGPGGNAFSYFVDPSNFAIEYTTGLKYSADRKWDVKEWKLAPENADMWGTSGGPNDQSKHAMSGVAQD